MQMSLPQKQGRKGRGDSSSRRGGGRSGGATSGELFRLVAW